jgi:hypothetical protein
MNNHVFKVEYSVANLDRNSSDYRVPIKKTKKMFSFMDAVRYCRLVANTEVSLVEKPIIDLSGT